ncbi:PE-PPE domain-containing protein [Mycolicibacterium sediminis]|nr:PE-PPE domain-containing protein [Mycolicibacterium sediminis]
MAIAGAMGMAATTPATAATALFVGGILAPNVPEFMMSQALGGQFTGTDEASGTPWVRQSVFWPAQAGPFLGVVTLDQSVATGTANLVAQIAEAQKSGTGPVTVVGTSAGSLVVDEALRYFKEHPDLAPDPNLVNFIVIGDGSRQESFTNSPIFTTVSGYTYKSPVDTPYDVTVVSYEYDGFADFPDRPLNLLAVANAVAGMLVLHTATFFADISKQAPTSVVTDPDTNGTTTRYFLKPRELPLVTLLPFLAPMQDDLKAMIDAGYSRNDAVAPSDDSNAMATDSAATDSAAAATGQPVPDPAAIPTQDSARLVSSSSVGEQRAAFSAVESPGADSPAGDTVDASATAGGSPSVAGLDARTSAAGSPTTGSLTAGRSGVTSSSTGGTQGAVGAPLTAQSTPSSTSTRRGTASSATAGLSGRGDQGIGRPGPGSATRGAGAPTGGSGGGTAGLSGSPGAAGSAGDAGTRRTGQATGKSGLNASGSASKDAKDGSDPKDG